MVWRKRKREMQMKGKRGEGNQTYLEKVRDGYERRDNEEGKKLKNVCVCVCCPLYCATGLIQIYIDIIVL